MSEQPTRRARYSSKSSSARRVGVPEGGNWGSKMVAIGAVVIAIVAVVVIGRYFYQSSQINVTPTLAEFERVADDEMRVAVDVSRKDPSLPAYCIVTALSYDKDEVGRREFLIGASDASLERFEIIIPTRKPAVAAKMYGCSSTIPSYLTEPTNGVAHQ
ncbi:DUF4307 domain-containing protein [Corynebacterium choanae]|uniref:DUF4307 domain-containing protein n=1 Tax=Corynebacterium choanae TaxID=1862358 RepID=A0A3G6J8D1_9CORY|nr:DUF4307 domain-containing protein [Corynebacterium choanae]AZA13158.1 hypothetical protein CCHOA_03745 [Corynebacterium choanae]